MIRNLQFRESGKINKIEHLVESERTSRLCLSKHHDFTPFHSSSVNCCDLDPVEQRYLLSGGDDGSIGVHDLHHTSPGTHFKLISSTRRHDTQHSSVSSLQWYPRDTGLFLSSGPDALLKIWDTNAMSLATEFKFHSAINSHKMSPSNLLVAVSNRQQVHIVDLRSGSHIHKLNGSHDADVTDVCWSPSNERQVISAGSDGRLLVWDTRRARSSCLKFEKVSGGKAHKAPISSVCIIPDRLHLLSLCRGGALALWDLVTGRHVPVSFDDVCNSSPSKVTLSATSSHAFVPSNNHITILHLSSGLVKRVLRGHMAKVTCVLHQSPLHHLISSSHDHSILYWSVDETPDKVNTATNLTNSEMKEREGGGGGGGVAGIDYFNYSAEEYYDRGGGKANEVGGDDDDASRLMQDNWSDDGG